MTYKCSVWVPAIPLPTHLQLLSPLTVFPPTAEASLLSFGPPGMFPLHSAYFSFQWTCTLFHPFSSLYKRHWLRGFPWPFLIKSNSRVHHQTYTPIPHCFHLSFRAPHDNMYTMLSCLFALKNASSMGALCYTPSIQNKAWHIALNKQVLNHCTSGWWMNTRTNTALSKREENSSFWKSSLIGLSRLILCALW